jgi:hypothetical protein
MPKYMPMMFFYFLKIIFDISTSKRSKKYKPHLILAKKYLKFSQKQVESQSQALRLVTPSKESWIFNAQEYSIYIYIVEAM